MIVCCEVLVAFDILLCIMATSSIEQTSFLLNLLIERFRRIQRTAEDALSENKTADLTHMKQSIGSYPT